MSDLIEALQILVKYGDHRWPTVCAHDVLYFVGIDPNEVSMSDRDRLEELGIDHNDEGFYSHRFGSA